MTRRKGEPSVLTPTKEGLITALKGPTGAIPNGRLARPAGTKAKQHLGRLSGNVTQLRPPVLGFTCDACGFPSYGWKAMSEHVDDTGHLTYTAIRNSLN